MALVPGTLPTGTCYGTPQDLLELFAQYLDLPSFTVSTVVQVVEGSTTTSVTVNTSTLTDTGLSVTITPVSASNRVLVLGFQNVQYYRSNFSQGANIKLLRNAVSLYSSSPADFLSVATVTGPVQKNSTYSFSYIDSPATNLATTYKVQGAPYDTTNSGAATFQHANARSSILAIELRS
jgi:hypothetical protein